jgi:hypothetical protein
VGERSSKMLLLFTFLSAIRDDEFRRSRGVRRPSSESFGESTTTTGGCRCFGWSGETLFALVVQPPLWGERLSTRIGGRQAFVLGRGGSTVTVGSGRHAALFGRMGSTTPTTALCFLLGGPPNLSLRKASVIGGGRCKTLGWWQNCR